MLISYQNLEFYSILSSIQDSDTLTLLVTLLLSADIGKDYGSVD